MTEPKLMKAHRQMTAKLPIVAALWLLLNFCFVGKMPAPITLEPESTPKSVTSKTAPNASIAPKTRVEKPGIAKNPAKSHYDRAGEKCKNGDWQGALTELDEAIRIDPSYADAYFDRGIIFQHFGQYDKAIVELTRAIRLQPGSAIAIQAHRCRCTTHMLLNRYNDAIADTNELLKIKTERLWAYSIQANWYSALGNSAAAEEATKKARELGAK